MKKKKVEEKYNITFKGLLSIALNYDQKYVQKVLDILELDLRRHHMEDGAGAIIYNGKDWMISTVCLKNGK